MSTALSTNLQTSNACKVKECKSDECSGERYYSNYMTYFMFKKLTKEDKNVGKKYRKRVRDENEWVNPLKMFFIYKWKYWSKVFADCLQLSTYTTRVYTQLCICNQYLLVIFMLANIVITDARRWSLIIIADARWWFTVILDFILMINWRMLATLCALYGLIYNLLTKGFIKPILLNKRWLYLPTNQYRFVSETVGRNLHQPLIDKSSL